jgi:small subunit ribosomal protein S17
MKSNRRRKVGKVLRRFGDKSVIVEVERHVLEPKFKKYIRRRKKFHVHDEKNEANVGDIVEIMDSRPISRTKRWRISSILEKGI